MSDKIELVCPFCDAIGDDGVIENRHACGTFLGAYEPQTNECRSRESRKLLHHIVSMLERKMTNGD